MTIVCKQYYLQQISCLLWTSVPLVGKQSDLSRQYGSVQMPRTPAVEKNLQKHSEVSLRTHFYRWFLYCKEYWQFPGGAFFFFLNPKHFVVNELRLTPEAYSRHLFVCFVAVSVPRLSLELRAFHLCNLALCIQIPDAYRHCSSSPPRVSSLPRAQVRPPRPRPGGSLRGFGG